MQYLIGEIGLSLLIAALIGLFIGWLIGRFRMSGESSRLRRRLESDVVKREREIDRLRYDLRNGRGRRLKGPDGPSQGRELRAPRNMSIAAGNKSSEQSSAGRGESYAVARRDMRDGASLTVTGRGESKATRASDLRDATYRHDRPHNRGDNDVALRARLDEETHLKVQALANAGERETELKRKLEDESYEKIQALARLGELERSAQRPTGPTVSSVTTAQLQDYQRLLDQKNKQVEQLQEKVRELMALRASAQAEKKTTTTNVSKAMSNDRERILKSSLEDESFAKAQALARVGELERLLSQRVDKPDNSQNELISLRRRAEQQEAVILDLRKKTDLQHQQANVMRQEFDRKRRQSEQQALSLKSQEKVVVGNDNERVLKSSLEDESFLKVQALARVGELERELTLIDGKAGEIPAASQAEIDSYKRKLSESDRAMQSQIKDFNATLESRNREYDLLGKRLEDLRSQIGQRDKQIVGLKTELDEAGKERIRFEADGNRLKEELGALKISAKEKDTNIVSLTSQARR